MSFRWSKMLVCKKQRITSTNYLFDNRLQAGLQIGAPRSSSDWLGLQERRFDWLRATPSEHPFENPSQSLMSPGQFYSRFSIALL